MKPMSSYSCSMVTADSKSLNYAEIKSESFSSKHSKSTLSNVHKIASMHDSFAKINIKGSLNVFEFIEMIFRCESAQKSTQPSVPHHHTECNDGEGRCEKCDEIMQEIISEGKVTKDEIFEFEKNHLELDQNFPQFFAGNEISKSTIGDMSSKTYYALHMLSAAYCLSMDSDFKNKPLQRDEYLSLAKSLYIYIYEHESELRDIAYQMYKKFQQINTDRTEKQLKELSSLAESLNSDKLGEHIQDHRRHFDCEIDGFLLFDHDKNKRIKEAAEYIKGKVDSYFIHNLDTHLTGKHSSYAPSDSSISKFQEYRASYFSSLISAILSAASKGK